ncbi:hypothetical protein SGFS_041890 [Streptomyces graminofaciens]|uniref:Cholesterol esterase n=1 Tax=Streptomyces graminofaciens TaxID=68212 RepID=A0ABM7FA82_9ACTN|nr:DUF6230 family protein [Streptomyces graminofaciens]BBC32895.1 hypothetical protein SGFS_041890 [Streptomyces graminofaciens]
MGSKPRGGTRWKRFAVVMVPSVAAAAAVGIGLAQGALAASFTVSGQQFKVRAGHLEGDGFAQYGGLVDGYTSIAGDKTTKRPVAISSFNTATINNLCQSLKTDIPLFGTVYMRIDAGSDKNKPVEAKQLYLDIAQLDGDAEFTNMDIGVAVKDQSKGPAVKDKGVLPGGFAQQADKAVLDNAEQVAWSTTAGTFKLSNLKLRLGTDSKMECF